LSYEVSKILHRRWVWQTERGWTANYVQNSAYWLTLVTGDLHIGATILYLHSLGWFWRDCMTSCYHTSPCDATAFVFSRTVAGDATGQLLSAAEVATLLAKEQLNCFGLLAPLHLQQQQQNPAAAAAAAGADADEDESEGRSSRRLRGGALYPICALLNHECIPNVARFDALDAAVGGAWPAQWPHQQQQQQQQTAAAVAAVAGSNAAAAAAALAAAAGLSAGPHGSSGRCGCGSNGGCGGGSSTTLVTMRALHGLPAGTEVVLSYVPVNWDLQDRQQQTQQVGDSLFWVRWFTDYVLLALVLAQSSAIRVDPPYLQGASKSSTHWWLALG
jgi:hypothetical protein